MLFCIPVLMYSFVLSVLDEFPAPPGSAYPGARPGQPGSEQDQRPYGQAAGPRPYGQDQRPGMVQNIIKSDMHVLHGH